MALPPIPPELLEPIVTVVAPPIWNQIKKYFSKDHGSKVKKGAFPGCSIEMFGDKACIVVNENSGEVVIVTWKSVSQERLDSKTLKAEHPKLCKKYINKTSYRRFEVKTAS